MVHLVMQSYDIWANRGCRFLHLLQDWSLGALLGYLQVWASPPCALYSLVRRHLNYRELQKSWRTTWITRAHESMRTDFLGDYANTASTSWGPVRSTHRKAPIHRFSSYLCVKNLHSLQLLLQRGPPSPSSSTRAAYHSDFRDSQHQLRLHAGHRP